MFLLMITLYRNFLFLSIGLEEKDMLFHENLKKYRLMVGCTQSQMARFLGMTERGYRYYENGQREPSLSALIQIADFMNVSLDQLVGRQFPKEPLMDPKEIL